MVRLRQNEMIRGEHYLCQITMPLFDNLLEGFPGVQVRVLIRRLVGPLDLETRKQDRFPGNLRPVVHQVCLFVLMPFPEIGKDAQ